MGKQPAPLTEILDLPNNGTLEVTYTTKTKGSLWWKRSYGQITINLFHSNSIHEEDGSYRAEKTYSFKAPSDPSLSNDALADFLNTTYLNICLHLNGIVPVEQLAPLEANMLKTVARLTDRTTLLDRIRSLEEPKYK